MPNFSPQIFHSDYFSGWDVDELQTVLDNCERVDIINYFHINEIFFKAKITLTPPCRMHSAVTGSPSRGRGRRRVCRCWRLDR